MKCNLQKLMYFVAILLSLSATACSSKEHELQAQKTEQQRLILEAAEIEKQTKEVEKETERLKATREHQKTVAAHIKATEGQFLRDTLFRSWPWILGILVLALLWKLVPRLFKLLTRVWENRHLEKMAAIESEHRLKAKALELAFDAFQNGQIGKSDLKVLANEQFLLPSYNSKRNNSNVDAPTVDLFPNSLAGSNIQIVGAPSKWKRAKIAALVCVILALIVGAFYAGQSVTFKRSVSQTALDIGTNTQQIVSERTQFDPMIGLNFRPKLSRTEYISKAFEAERTKVYGDSTAAQRQTLGNSDVSILIDVRPIDVELLQDQEIWQRRLDAHIRYVRACDELRTYLKINDVTLDAVKSCPILNDISLPEEWRPAFNPASTSGFRLSFEKSSSRFLVQLRQKPLVDICNAAPYELEFFLLSEFAEKADQAVYAALLELELEEIEFSPIGNILPGACKAVQYKALTEETQPFIGTIPENSEKVEWIRTEFFNAFPAAASKNLSDWNLWLEENGALLMCDSLSTRSPKFLHQSCAKDERISYLGAHVPENQKFKSYRFVFEEPVFQRHSPELNYEFDSVVIDHWLSQKFLSSKGLKSRLSVSQFEAEIIDDQYSKFNKWSKFRPVANLGASLGDLNGPFSQGILVKNLPRTTIWSESVSLPENGILMEFNTKPILSIYDLADAMDKHARDLKSGGVHIPVQLTYLDQSSNTEIVSTTRLLYDPSVPQSFPIPTVGSFMMGGGRGAIAGQFLLFCGSAEILKTATNSVFDTINPEADYVLNSLSSRDFSSYDSPSSSVSRGAVKKCEWMLQQQAAFAKQENPQAFNWGEMVAPIVPMGRISSILLKATKAGKVVKGSRLKALTSGHVVSMGWFEGIADVAWQIGLEPPGTPLAERLKETPETLAYGFLSGAGMEVILPPGSKKSKKAKSGKNKTGSEKAASKKD